MPVATSDCNHSAFVSKWRTRPTPRRCAIPRAALASIRSSIGSNWEKRRIFWIRMPVAVPLTPE
eukprot:15484031-Alexandrium_andersonii.AAC.1